jgi:ribosomal-protein-alanine N-acetyltransferase
MSEDEEYSPPEGFIECKCPYCGEITSFFPADAGKTQDCPFCSETFVAPTQSCEFGQKLPIPIETTRLILRRPRPEDRTDLIEITSDEEFFNYQRSAPWDESNVDQWFETANRARLTPPGRGLILAMELKQTQRLLGWATVGYLEERPEQSSRRQATLGVAIGCKFQRQGYGTEAVQALLKFGFQGINVRRMTAKCDARNAAMRGLLEKAGMKLEGLFVQDTFDEKDEWCDTAYYAILAGELATEPPVL